MKRLLYMAMSLFAVAFVACNDDSLDTGNVDTGYLELVSSDVNFNYNGGTGEIVVDTQSTLTATVAPAPEGEEKWASATVNGNVVKVTVPFWSGLQTRNTSIVLTAGNRSVTVPVSQTAYGLLANPTSLAFTSASGSATVAVTPTDVAVTATSSADWVTTILDNSTLTVTVKANGLFARQAVITITGTPDGNTFNLPVSQAAAPMPATSTLSWQTWANGVYVGYGLGMQKTTTLSKAVGYEIFRIDSPYATGFHFTFTWDIVNRAISITPVGQFTTTYQGVVCPVQDTGLNNGTYKAMWMTDPDPTWTYYSPEDNAFIINSFYGAFIGTTLYSYFADWTDDYFIITEFLQGNPWQ